MTSTSIPAGRTDADSAERVRVNPDPAAKAVEMAQETRSVFGDAAKMITEKPIAAAAVVAAIAYFFGATR